MVLLWASRCIPGFSVIALFFLLILAFPDVVPHSRWKLSPSRQADQASEVWRPMSFMQKVFAIYSILIHLNMFGFTVRLSFAVLRVTKGTKAALWRREKRDVNGTTFAHAPNEEELLDLSASDASNLDDLKVSEVVHSIIIPNFGEDIDTLRSTLAVLASHPRAHSQYEICLAMEQVESDAAEKAAKLVSAFNGSFLNIWATFHPSRIPGEIAGKSSNVAFAARSILDIHRTELSSRSCNVIITVMDADTHFMQDYFLEVRRLHYAHPGEADRSVYCSPIIFDRNAHESPLLVRCADLIWTFAGLSTMYPGSPISIPTSAYSLPITLADRVGGWDSDSTSIGEDMHMLLKCYFETAGSVVSRIVYVPASQCNIHSNKRVGWRRNVDTCTARYRQAVRHMWGALDSGFAARRTIGSFRLNKRCLFFRPRHVALLHLLWEAHFLPLHLAVLMLFSVLYAQWALTPSLSPSLIWTFWFTDLLRTASFILMNVCLVLYGRWHQICIRARKQDMRVAKLSDAGFSERTWWHPRHLLEGVTFPIAGTVYGSVPIMHAVFAHFWTDRLMYRVSEKPTFNMMASAEMA